MLIDITHLAVEADHRRAAMLADAENFRLTRLVRAARRARSGTATPRSDPPGPPRAAGRATDRSGRNDAPRNDDAERRHAVSR